MKKFLLLILPVLFLSASVMAQTDSTAHFSKKDDGEVKTLFHKSGHKPKAGFYIGADAAYTQFKSRDVFLAGLSLGAIIDHFFSVGLGGYAIVNSSNLWYDNIDPYNSQGAYLYGGYGGLKLEFKVMPTFPVHVNFPILIGGGGLVYNTWNIWNDDHNDGDSWDGYTIDWDAFFVVEPGVMVELNLVKFMRLDVGVSYRYTPDLDLVNTPGSLINNFNANVSLKFGKF